MLFSEVQFGVFVCQAMKLNVFKGKSPVFCYEIIFLEGRGGSRAPLSL